jgi:hypothetical protein
MSTSGSYGELRQRPRKAVEPQTTLRIGYRKGWPGQIVQDLVTHAVFQVGDGSVRGFGMVNSKGQIVNDSDAVAAEHRRYTWYVPTLNPDFPDEEPKSA